MVIFIVNSCKKDKNTETNETDNNEYSGSFPGQMIWVEGGSFQMGSDNGQPDEQPVHSVSLDGFYISAYEITNRQYADFMNEIGVHSDGTFPETINGTEYDVLYINLDDTDAQIFYENNEFKVVSGKENHPVFLVTWYGANAYAKHYDGSLPTEAEWEFAARGGTVSKGYIYSGGDNLDEVAWNGNNLNDSSQVVGTKKANELGIYDMSGNVWEWCKDFYQEDYYSISPEQNPQGPDSSYTKVSRGGSWYNTSPEAFRAVNRYKFTLSTTFNILGFRIVSH